MSSLALQRPIVNILKQGDHIHGTRCALQPEHPMQEVIEGDVAIL